MPGISIGRQGGGAVLDDTAAICPPKITPNRKKNLGKMPPSINK